MITQVGKSKWFMPLLILFILDNTISNAIKSIRNYPWPEGETS